MYNVLGVSSVESGQATVDAAAQFHPFFPGLIILLPLVGFLINGALALSHAQASAGAVRLGGELNPGEGGHLPVTHKLPSYVAPGVMLIAFLIACVNFARMLGVELHDPHVIKYWTWIATGAFTVDAAIQLDQLSILMTMIVTGVGFLIHVFSVGYMRADAGYPRYFSYLNLFIFFMLVLVMGASYPLMFVGWEGVGLCSYLLIGFWFSDREKSDAGKKAFIVNRIGDFGFLIAMFLLFGMFGTLDFIPLFSQADDLEYGSGLVTAVTLFLFLGAAGKSAQIPLYVWLPDAMAGPTPVSALIHAATMVTAGVYLVARSSVLYALSPIASATVAGVGVLTALFAATIALKQNDIKKVLAYSTVSQLGYMFVGVGVGAYAAGIFHLMTHAFFKALLFLGAGSVIHSMHHSLHRTNNHQDPQDMRNMGGLRAFMPITTFAISGIWPFAGFFSKDEIIWQTAAFGGATEAPYPGLYQIYWAIALVAAILTAFYMTRMMVMTFHGSSRTGVEEVKHLHESPPVMWIPLIALALFSVVAGWINVPQALRETFVGLGPLTSEWLHHWLEPITEQAHHIQELNLGEVAEQSPFGGGEVTWALVSTILALVTVLASFQFLRRQNVNVAAEDTEPSGFSKLLYNKWYIDEIYDRLIVQPLIQASHFCWRVIDARVIDGVVNGVGWAARGLGFIVSMFQTGTVNMYAFVLTIGALIILGVSVF